MKHYNIFSCRTTQAQHVSLTFSSSWGKRSSTLQRDVHSALLSSYYAHVLSPKNFLLEYSVLQLYNIQSIVIHNGVLHNDVNELNNPLVSQCTYYFRMSPKCTDSNTLTTLWSVSWEFREATIYCSSDMERKERMHTLVGRWVFTVDGQMFVSLLHFTEAFVKPPLTYLQNWVFLPKDLTFSKIVAFTGGLRSLLYERENMYAPVSLFLWFLLVSYRF